MSKAEPARMSHVTAHEWRDWLRDGVLRMCGLREGAEHAFEPWAGHIGRAREFSWVDELARFAIDLDATVRHRFDQGLDQALVDLVGSDLRQCWVAVLTVLDLMRSIGAQERARGLAALADALHADAMLDVGLRRQLAAGALLAACDAESQDRVKLRPVASRLAEQVIMANAPASAVVRENVRRSLSRIGVDAAELKRLGLPSDDAQGQRFTAYVNRFKYGHTAGNSSQPS